MKKILVLFSFLLLVSVSVKAEVFPSVDDDVGIEQALFSVESQVVVASVMTIENLDVSDVYFTSFGIETDLFEIDNTFYVSESSLDFIRRVDYSKYNLQKQIKPPTENLLKLSSSCLVGKQGSLRA